MRKLKVFFSMLILSILALSSCSSIKILPGGKQIDKKLVGVWKGSETNQQVKGVKKEWQMIRKKDGTFVLNFRAVSPKRTFEFTETGNWWVKGNTFYEYHKRSGKTDKYKYAILNKKQVRFELLYSAVNFENKDYTFVDTKISKVKSNKNKAER